MVAVTIIISVTAGNNYLKDKQFRRLNAQCESRNINAIRQGEVKSVNVQDLLVGDIVMIETGRKAVY